MNRSQQLPSISTWKRNHSKQALIEIATDPALFNKGYRLQAINPGDLKFPSWPKCRQSGVVLEELWKRQLPAYVGVDLAGKKRPGNAIVVIGIEPGTLRRYLLNVRYGAWSSPDTAKNLAEMCAPHNVQYIQVENNAYQDAIIDWIKKNKTDFPFWMKIEPFTTGANKAEPDIGLPVIEVEFHNDAWVIPYSEYEGHPPTCHCDWCRLDAEVSLYPKAAATDGVMALWFARDAANKWSPRPPRQNRGNMTLR